MLDAVPRNFGRNTKFDITVMHTSSFGAHCNTLPIDTALLLVPPSGGIFYAERHGRKVRRVGGGAAASVIDDRHENLLQLQRSLLSGQSSIRSLPEARSALADDS